MNRNRFRRRKKSLSEKFQIGLGKYCHGEENTSHNSNDLSFKSNKDYPSKSPNISPTKEPISSVDKIIVDTTDNCTSNINNVSNGKFVHDVQFSQMSHSVTKEGSGSESNPINIQLTCEGVADNNNNVDKIDSRYVSDLQFTQAEKCSENSKTASTDNIDNIPNKTTKPNHNATGDMKERNCASKSCIVDNINSKNISKGERPNYVKLHAEYIKSWRNNPPAGESRPMRLLEYVYSLCNGDEDTDSDDSFAIALKVAKKKRGITTRELFSQLDAKYEAQRAEKEAQLFKKFDYVDESSEGSNNIKQSSIRSIVEIIDSPLTNDKMDDDSSLSSHSSDDSKLHCVNNCDTLNECPAITNTDVLQSTEDNASNVIVSICNTLHIPDNFNSIYYSSDDDNVKEKKLFEFDGYLTDSLIDEMSNYYPKAEDYTTDPLTNDIKMNKQKFESNFSKFFPKGRIFINMKQLKAAVKEFFKHWNLLSKCNGKSIRCSYSYTPAKKKDPTENLSEESDLVNTNYVSIASQTKCPFHLKWSLVDHKMPYRHEIFYRVKISSVVNTQHTCMMSHISYRYAVKRSSGHSKLDLTLMNTAISLLKFNPSMPTNMLRPILKDCLPCTTNIDGKYVDNFRRRVAFHHIKNANQGIVSMDQCKVLSRSQDLSKYDFIGMNDPLIRANLNDMYAKVMENDSHVWSALQYLENCKETIPGFDYRVLRSRKGNPTALLYMTSRMRYNLIRYGNIIFIDGQKRKYNQLNWPYIGPCIRNSDNRVGVTCESIVTSEDNDTYTWVFKSMLSIEPRWSLSNIKILYADSLITSKLLDNLGISNTCILHGDYFHLYKENWPKPENFGAVTFKVIKSQLSKMLTCSKQSEWDKAFKEASEKLIAHPLKLELLEEIYANPEYYAGYVTHQIIGNLRLNGTAHAEQNHSSIVRFNGEAMLGSIMNHLKSLMERQQQICNKENDFENDNLVRTNHYKPTLDRELGYEELVAKQSLSEIPHKNYFIGQLKSSEKLQLLYDNEICSHKVWPAGEQFNANNSEHFVIKIGDRCNCWRRVDFDIQCKHELKINPKFKVLNWGHRWYNRREFNKQYPNLSTFETHPNATVEGITNDNNNYTDSHSNKDISTTVQSTINNDDDEIFNTILDKNGSKVTYNDVLEIATDLCRTVSDNPTLCKSTYATIFEWITKLREGEKFKVTFNNIALPQQKNCYKAKNPLAAVITPPNGRYKSRKRYKSSSELRRCTTGRKGSDTYNPESDSSVDTNSFNNDVEWKPTCNSSKRKNMNKDNQYVTAGNSDKKYCFLCRQPRCTRWTCTILKGYEKVPGRILIKGNQESRDKLINLIATVDNHVLCHNRSEEDKRFIYDELPRKIKAIVLCKKYIIENNLSNISQHDNVCIECILLGDYGKAIDKYNKALFTKNCVIRHIGRSKNNLVVDNLS